MLAKIAAAVVEAVKIARKVRAVATFLTTLSEQGLEGLIRSVVVGEIMAGMARAGIRLDTLASWDSELLDRALAELEVVLAQAAAGPAAEAVTVSRTAARQDLVRFVDRLRRGLAVANPARPERGVASGADPVLFASGEFEHGATDLHVDGAGMDFTFRRTYRSGAAYFGPLGPGWDHSANLRAREDNDHVVVLLTGRLGEHRYVRHPRFGEAGFSYYSPPHGVHDILEPDGAGSFVLRRPQLVVHRFEAGEPGEHRIRRIEDQHGNHLDFLYDPDGRLARVRVNNPHRAVEFTYDEQDRLARLRDHAGRVVTYAYDDEGNLHCVRGPEQPGEPAGNAEGYQYDTVEGVPKLTLVLDWADRALMENEYETDALSEFSGRIVRQRQNRGESHFEYATLAQHPDPSTPDRDRPTLVLVEHRRNGHRVEHVLNAAGNEIARREQTVEGGAAREVIHRHRYNDDGNLVASIDPTGVLVQYLYGRDHVADLQPWADIDPTVGDLDAPTRAAFGNLLATVTRARRVPRGGDLLDGSYWQALPHVKAAMDPMDAIVKFRHDPATQLLLSRSDSRFTLSADPLHVESADPGTPLHDPTDPRYVAHQRHLTRHEYGPAPRHLLLATVHPDRTRPAVLDGVAVVGPIREEFRAHDARGRLLVRADARGYEWIQAYHPPDADPVRGAREGFVRHRLLPHADVRFDGRRPAHIGVTVLGTWTQQLGHLSSGGSPADAIRVSVEGVRITLSQTTRAGEVVSANPGVAVRVDGVPHSVWDQTTAADHLIEGLPRNLHTVELFGPVGSSVAIGRVHSHVAVDIAVDVLGRPVRETDALGHETKRTFSALGHETGSQRGPAGPHVLMTLHEHDPRGRLVATRVPWRDESGLPVPGGEYVERHTLDVGGHALRTSTGAGEGFPRRVLGHRYDAEDNVIETVNARLVRTYHVHDALDRAVMTVRGACTEQSSSTRIRYDGAGRVLAERNGRGAMHANGHRPAGGGFRSGWSTQGDVEVHTDALGNLDVVTYDQDRNPLVVRRFQRRADGSRELVRRSATAYDELGDPVRVSEAVFREPLPTPDPVAAPDAAFFAAVAAGDVAFVESELHRDAVGDVVATRRPNGAIERRTYDAHRRVTAAEDGEERFVLHRYDGNGNSVETQTFDPVRDPVSNAVTHHEVFVELREYDHGNRLTARVDAYGNRWESRHDTLGNATTTTDPLGNVTRSKFNAFGQEIRRVRELTRTGLGGGVPDPPEVVEREYDPNGNTTAIVDGRGRRTRLNHDSLDRLARVTFTLGGDRIVEDRKYDPADNLVLVRDGNGLVRRMRYDLLNRHVRTDVDATAVPAVHALSPLSATCVVLDHDAAGGVRLAENDHCRVTFRRDSLGLPYEETIEVLGDPAAPPPQVLARGFDAEGRVTVLVLPSGRRVDWIRDLAGRVLSVRSHAPAGDYPGSPALAGPVTLASYAFAGRRLRRVELANGVVVDVRHDGRGHAVERRVQAPAGLLWREQRLRDAAGRLRLETTTTRAGARGRTMYLDSLYQLAHYEDGPASWLDPLTVAPPHSAVPPAEAAAQQTAIDAHVGPMALPAAPRAFDYDLAGNRLRGGEPGLAAAVYVPDGLNRYASVGGVAWQHDRAGNTRADGVLAFEYDYQHQLVSAADLPTGTPLAEYRRDALGRVVIETTPAGRRYRFHDGDSPVVEFVDGARREFVWGRRPGTPLHAALDGKDLWVVTDETGSPRVVADGAGVAVALPVFRPFGQAEDEELALSPLDLGYAGLWRTQGLVLGHGVHRTYVPAVGRWLQRDPAGFVDGLNLYAYVGNSPLDFHDPIGLQATPLDDAARATILAFRQLFEDVPQDELPASAVANPKDPGRWGRWSHLTLEMHLTFQPAPSGIDHTRLVPEVAVDSTGKIKGVGVDPATANRKGWRTVDAALLKPGVLSHPGPVAWKTELVGKQASEVMIAGFDYKTGNASLERVREMQALIGVPYVKAAKGVDLLRATERKLARFANAAVKRAPTLARAGAKLGKGLAKLAPVVGFGAAAFSAKQAWARGDYGEATLDAIGAVPGIGDVVDLGRLGWDLGGMAIDAVFDDSDEVYLFD